MNNIYLLNDYITNGFKIEFVDIIYLVSIFLGVFTIISRNPMAKFGKLFQTWVKLPNSGNLLKLLIPSNSRKAISGWSNYSGKVTSQKILERGMEYRGSKSVPDLKPTAIKYKSGTVKEQRVDGSWYEKKSYLRCTLFGFERNHLAKIPSNLINLSRQFSTQTTLLNKGLYPKFELNHLNPWFLTGFIDG